MKDRSNAQMTKLEMLPKVMKGALDDEEFVEVYFEEEMINALEEL